MPARRGAATLADPEPGRVVACFGASGAGVSTLLRVLHEESETPTALVASGDGSVVLAAVEAARGAGAEVILLDGLPRNVDDVQWLYDERLVAPGWGGAVIRLDRHAVVDARFWSGLSSMEGRIRDLSLPYFVVRNDDAEQAALDLASRIGLWR